MRAICTACIVILSMITSHAEIVITAVNAPHANTHSSFAAGAGMSTDGPVFDNRLAQSFLATTTGILEDVTFVGRYYTFDVPTVSLRVDLTQFGGGQPGSILATAYVPLSQFPSSVPFPPLLNVTASFSGSGVQLVGGVNYALVFRSDSVEANYSLSGGYQETLYGVPGYPAGQAFSSQNSPTFQAMSSTADLYFQVRVVTVPEPSPLLFAGFGCVLLLLVTRRNLVTS